MTDGAQVAAELLKIWRSPLGRRATEIAIEVCGGRPARCYGWKAKIFDAASEAALKALEVPVARPDAAAIAHAIIMLAQDYRDGLMNYQEMQKRAAALVAHDN